MNSSVYIFGGFGAGYTQYPDDYAKEIYQNFYTKSTAPSQIAIHRDNNLIYYGYIRKIDVGMQYIGFCIVLNGVMFSKIEMLFSIFENAVTDLVTRGEILHFNDRGEIVSSINNLYEKQQEIERIVSSIQNQISNLGKMVQKLPPVDYNISNSEIKIFSENDKNEDIANASYRYGYIYILKNKDYDTLSLTSYRSIIVRLNKEKNDLVDSNNTLKHELRNQKIQQRNLKLVSVFGAIILILGVIVWNKVLFPSEVTRYKTDQFLYYGPMVNKKPHGEGVAFYPSNDKDGRRYYIGHFINGERQDTAAMLYYQNGDYYYGSMNGDKFLKGIFYSNSDKSHFEGSFINNRPHEGTWYYHEKGYQLKNGKMN